MLDLHLKKEIVIYTLTQWIIEIIWLALITVSTIDIWFAFITFVACESFFTPITFFAIKSVFANTIAIFITVQS